MSRYPHLSQSEDMPPRLRAPAGNPTIKATSLLRLTILGLSPIVILSFLSRTAQRHIVFWPCIIFGISSAVTLAQLLKRIKGVNSYYAARNPLKNPGIPVGALIDALCAVAILIATYIVTWKRPRADRAESLIALVMAYIAGVVQLIVAVATSLRMDFDISVTPSTSDVQLSSDDFDEETDLMAESSSIKYSNVS